MMKKLGFEQSPSEVSELLPELLYLTLQFLFDSKVGYHEFFSEMALLLRLSPWSHWTPPPDAQGWLQDAGGMNEVRMVMRTLMGDLDGLQGLLQSLPVRATQDSEAIRLWVRSLL